MKSLGDELSPEEGLDFDDGMFDDEDEQQGSSRENVADAVELDGGGAASDARPLLSGATGMAAAAAVDEPVKLPAGASDSKTSGAGGRGRGRAQPSSSENRSSGRAAASRASGSTSAASASSAPRSSDPTPVGKKRKISRQVSRRMLVEDKPKNAALEDKLIDRAKIPPYDFGEVPGCSRDLDHSCILKINARRMATHAIAEIFHLCNEAARRFDQPTRDPALRAAAAASGGLSASGGKRIQMVRGSGQPVAVTENFFESGEVIECPNCAKNMKAPCRAPALRCAGCKGEIHTHHRKLPPSAAGNRKTTRAGAGVCPAPVSDPKAARNTQKGKKFHTRVSSGRGAARAGGNSPNRKRASRETVYEKPLSLDYIADRLDIDNPLNGYMIRHRQSGWLQGFVLLTTFTTWQRWFRWDSTAKESGLREDGKKGKGLHLDTNGRLSSLLEQEGRSGDPEKEGVIWPRIAELSLLGALKCGRTLVQLAIDSLESGDDYDYLILQATDQSRPFYEKLGFVRVGALARYVPPGKKVDNCPVTGYRHWTFSDEPEARMPEPSYMMVFQLDHGRASKGAVIAHLEPHMVSKVPKIRFAHKPDISAAGKSPTEPKAPARKKAAVAILSPVVEDDDEDFKFSCEQCKKGFKRACELGNHLRGHARQKLAAAASP